MPLDRTATLRNAEKLIRQGKIEPAIAEYLRVVDDQPRDWNTANTLGDLYVRAGQVDRAVDQFMRIADSLYEEGFRPKAGALYKKILKLKPDHEHALLQAGDIAAKQGLYADARALLGAVADKRRLQGDVRGAAEIRVRIGTLDPADYAGRMAASSARVELGDAAGAVRDLKDIASELTEKGRQADAIEALRAAALIDPGDDEIRSALLQVYVASEDFVRARECATTAADFRTLADSLDLRGRADDALVMLREAARLDPADAALQTYLARAFVARGDMVAAAEYLTVEGAGDDAQLLLTVAEIRLRSGKIDEAMAIARRLVDEDSSRRDQIALLGWTVAEQSPEAGFRAVELAADLGVGVGDWGGAAAALQEFVTRVPNHIPALMRLVEICVDGGLEATMFSAQAQLADAYIAAGAAAEARVIAEDLVAREPWDRANIERFRRTLVLMNDPDPDALIAERLSGQSPFLSTDFSMASDELPPFEGSSPQGLPPVGEDEPHMGQPAEPEPAVEAAPQVVAEPEPGPEASGTAEERRVEAPLPRLKAPRRPPHEDTHFELSANAVDIESILNELESPRFNPPAEAPAKPLEVTRSKGGSQAVEVDLSIVLDDIKRPPAPLPNRAAGQTPAGSAADLDGVFEHLRDEAGRRSAIEAAEGEYARALALREAGDIDGCIAALQVASRAPKLRFVTASLLARLFKQRGMMPHAIEWFERAAQAPASTVEESHQLLWELADALETVGESARALAICLELQADAGAYRDVAERIQRLGRIQARG